MQMHVSSYYNEKTQDFSWKKTPDEMEVLALQVSHLSFDSVVMVASRIHQALDTLT